MGTDYALYARSACEKIIKSFFQIYGLSRTGYGNRQYPENLDLKVNPRKNRLHFVQLLRWLWLQAAKRYLAVPRMQTKGKNKAVASFCLDRLQKSIEKSPTAGYVLNIIAKWENAGDNSSSERYSLHRFNIILS